MEIVYEVRARFTSPELRERYLRWLREGHLDAVVAGGALEGEARASDEMVISRYRFSSRAAFEAYEQDPAVALRAAGKALFTEGVTMERSVEEVQVRRLRAPLQIVPVPCLSDNYAYLLIDRDAGTAIVVDPSEAGPVEKALSEEGVTLEAAWCTHHHFDHVGGNLELAAAHAGLAILGSAHDAQAQQIPGLTRSLADGEAIHFGARTFQVMNIPGHTLGAIAYVGDGLAFTGDTLFSGGCGRVFEGTMSMMRGSMEKLMGLPPSTRIYSGHEYTVKNLEFAQAVEPNAKVIEARLKASRQQREHGEPTVGGLLADELATNPFLRWESPEVIAFAAERGEAGHPDEVFARIREAKNSF